MVFKVFGWIPGLCGIIRMIYLQFVDNNMIYRFVGPRSSIPVCFLCKNVLTLVYYGIHCHFT